MNAVIRLTIGLVQGFGQRIYRGVSTRGALGISVILHIFILMAFASFFVGTHYIKPQIESATVVLDLQTERDVKDVKLEKNINNQTLSGSNSTKPADVEGFNGTAADAAGSPSSVAKRSTNQQAVVLSSLASLSDLKESFNFVMQKTSADTTNGFAPVQGNAPDTKFYTAGSKNGQGFGNGNGGFSISIGGGHCPAPGTLN
ncbi:MAG: hypothetical protein ACE5HO_14585 [bacterium]